MQTAALIVAAGMSSRMGDFKPMLNIGSISIAQRVVATFQQAGIRKIVMVTGYNAVALERHLSESGVIELFLESITGRRQKPRYCEVIHLRWENERFTQSEESL